MREIRMTYLSEMLGTAYLRLVEHFCFSKKINIKMKKLVYISNIQSKDAKEKV